MGTGFLVLEELQLVWVSESYSRGSAICGRGSISCLEVVSIYFFIRLFDVDHLKSLLNLLQH